MLGVRVHRSTFSSLRIGKRIGREATPMRLCGEDIGADALHLVLRNTKCSTEAELVGVRDILPQVLWTRYFLEAHRGTELRIIYCVSRQRECHQGGEQWYAAGRAESARGTLMCDISVLLTASRARRLAWRTVLPQTSWQIFFQPLRGALSKGCVT